LRKGNLVGVIYHSKLTETLQVGHIMCDNASNNSTMMWEVAVQLKAAMGKKYIWHKRKKK